MLGLYDRTPEREKVVLDGWWTFCTDPEESGELDGYVAQFPSSRPITVPGCWHTEFGLFDYHGVAWYRKTFESPFAGKALLTFGAVADLARAWLNGQLLGEHEGGHTAFSFTVDVEIGDNELVAVKSLVPHGALTLLSMTFHVLDSGCWEHRTETAVLRHWTRDDLSGAVARAGLSVRQVFGGYDRSPFDAASSPDLLCAFQRPA